MRRMATVLAQPEEARTGLSEALQIVRNLWTRCGPKYALLWLAQGTVCRALSLRVLHICVHATDELGADDQLPPGYALRVATDAEMARGVPDDPTFPDWPVLQRYIDGGDVMIAAFHGGQIVSYGWCSARPAAIAEDLSIQFGPGFLYGHRAFTTRPHRGIGLHAAIIRYSRRVAVQRGQTMVAYVDANNHRSLVSESRVGKMKSGVAVILQRSKRLRYWASPLARRAGFSLRRPPGGGRAG
jgi:hypothetical protein